MGCKLYANEVRTLPIFKLLSMFFKAPWIRKTFLKQSYFVYRKFWKLSYSQIFCTKLHAVVQLESLLSACNDSNMNSSCHKNKTFTVLNCTAIQFSLLFLLLAVKRFRWNRPVFFNRLTAQQQFFFFFRFSFNKRRQRLAGVRGFTLK